MALPKTEHPLFDVEIPSLKKKVKARPSLTREEKILLMAKESANEFDILNAIKTVVNNCVVDKKFNVDELTIFDLEYMFLRIRSASVSNVAKISFIDKTDDRQYDFSITLDEVAMREPEKEISDKIVIKDMTIQLRYPRASLYSDKTFWDSDKVNDNLMAHCIDKIFLKDEVFDPRKEKHEDVIGFLDDLPVTVYQQIQDFVSNPPSLYYKIVYQNSKKEDRTIELKSLEDFFTLR